MILALNAGSSSLKFSLYRLDDIEKPDATGVVSRIGQRHAEAVFEDAEGNRRVQPLAHGTHSAAAKATLDWLGPRVPRDARLLVGHRVVHGGVCTSHTLIDEEVTAAIDSAAAFAPLHNPPALEVIRATRHQLGADSPMVAVLDTAFFADLPEIAARYAIPWELSERHGIRRYGFHGLAHESMTHASANLLGRAEDQLTITTLQLGNGCSAALVVNGRAVDTSMGMTPLEGLMMGTRSGSLDPAIVAFIAEREEISATEVIDLLNSESGLAGVSGISSDWRDLEAAAAAGNRQATVAVEMFAYRVRKQIGAYIAAASHPLDVVVFGGGIGEHAANLRLRVLDGLEYLGIKVDKRMNAASGAAQARLISTPDSKTRVMVAQVDEMRVIAEATLSLVGAL